MNCARPMARLSAPRLLRATPASALTPARPSPWISTSPATPKLPGQQLGAHRFSQFPFSSPQAPTAQSPTAYIPMPYITEVTVSCAFHPDHQTVTWRLLILTPISLPVWRLEDMCVMCHIPHPPSFLLPLLCYRILTPPSLPPDDIFSKLLQERIICVNGAIDDTVSASIVAQLLWLESDNPEKPITMYIHSPGGSVTAGLSIYDTMSYIRSPVHTICLGQAASMGSLLLTGGSPGKRFALPNSSIMIHQPLGGTQGQASDILIYANQIQRTRHQVNQIYLHHLNAAFPGRQTPKYDIKDVEDMMERDKYLSAEEAKDLGIVDEIMIRRDPKAGEPKKE